MNKKTIFYILMAFFAIILCFNLYQLDLNDLGTKANIGLYIGIASNILFIVAMYFLAKNSSKQKKD